MSYCRFGTGDVYMFPTIEGIVCQLCKLQTEAASERFTYRSKALKHLHMHRDAGHEVPDKAFKRLEQEIKTIGDTVETLDDEQDRGQER